MVRVGVGVRGRVVVTVSVDGVENAVGGFVKSLTKTVVLALVVVISHITLVLLRCVDSRSRSLFYTNFSSGRVTRVDNVNLTP